MLRYGVETVILLMVIISCSAFVEDMHECPPERKRELNDEDTLHTDLLCAYKSEYRPVKNHKDVINVKVRFALKYLSFDSLEETVTIHSWVAFMWKDEYLTWTPSNYGGIKELQMESHNIWSPRLALFNADANIYQPDSIYTTCLVTNDGTVTCVPHLAHTAMCRTTIRNWPYDTQNCSLFFGSWMHTGEQINFTFYNTKPVSLDEYQNGPGWKLLTVENERLPGLYSTNTTYPMLKYKFILEREAGGLSAVIIIPILVIILLTLISLFLNVRDNTRLFLVCFSLFLHFTYLNEISYDIPKYSSDTPIILLFLRDSMIITLVVILETLILMALRKRVVPAYNWINTLNRLVKAGPGKYVVFTEFDPTDVTDGKTLTDDGAGEERTRFSNDWIEFSNVVNSFVLIVCVIVYLVLISTYIPADR